MTEVAAVSACIILTALALFQVFLIAGFPMGRFAWGGKHTVLPKQLRIASMFSVVLYSIFGLAILSKASLLGVNENPPTVAVAMWIFTGYFFLGIAMNAISRSKPERMLMTPVAVVLAVLFLVVSLK